MQSYVFNHKCFINLTIHAAPRPLGVPVAWTSLMTSCSPRHRFSRSWNAGVACAEAAEGGGRGGIAVLRRELNEERNPQLSFFATSFCISVLLHFRRFPHFVDVFFVVRTSKIPHRYRESGQDFCCAENFQTFSNF